MYAIALARRHMRLAPEGFSLSAADPDIQETPGRSVLFTCRFPRLCRLKCVKSSLYASPILTCPLSPASRNTGAAGPSSDKTLAGLDGQSSAHAKQN